MGKLVPFDSAQVKKVTQKATVGDRSQAALLVREAAALLSQSKSVGSNGSGAPVQWILEDCIDLLERTAELESSDMSGIEVDVPLENGKNCQSDPRHILNRGSVLESVFRGKRK